MKAAAQGASSLSAGPLREALGASRPGRAWTEHGRGARQSQASGAVKRAHLLLGSKQEKNQQAPLNRLPRFRSVERLPEIARPFQPAPALRHGQKQSARDRGPLGGGRARRRSRGAACRPRPGRDPWRDQGAGATWAHARAPGEQAEVVTLSPGLRLSPSCLPSQAGSGVFTGKPRSLSPARGWRPASTSPVLLLRVLSLLQRGQ